MDHTHRNNIEDRIDPEECARNSRPAIVTDGRGTTTIHRVDNNVESQSKTSSAAEDGPPSNSIVDRRDNVRQMIARHKRNRLRFKNTSTFEITPTAQHLGKPKIIRRRGYHNPTARKKIYALELSIVGIGKHRQLSITPVPHMIGQEPIQLGGWDVKERINHSQRLEQPLVQKSVKRLPANSLDQNSEHVDGHAIMPLLTWLKL